MEVLLAFLKLGLTCFGGPIVHIGYFRDEFVLRRKWIDEHSYADLVGLCQFLPGPATLPSAAALVLFVYGAEALNGPSGNGLLHGLKLNAVAIVRA